MDGPSAVQSIVHRFDMFLYLLDYVRVARLRECLHTLVKFLDSPGDFFQMLEQIGEILLISIEVAVIALCTCSSHLTICSTMAGSDKQDSTKQGAILRHGLVLETRFIKEHTLCRMIAGPSAHQVQ